MKLRNYFHFVQMFSVLKKGTQIPLLTHAFSWRSTYLNRDPSLHLLCILKCSKLDLEFRNNHLVLALISNS